MKFISWQDVQAFTQQAHTLPLAFPPSYPLTPTPSFLVIRKLLWRLQENTSQASGLTAGRVVVSHFAVSSADRGAFHHLPSVGWKRTRWLFCSSWKQWTTAAVSVLNEVRYSPAVWLLLWIFRILTESLLTLTAVFVVRESDVAEVHKLNIQKSTLLHGKVPLQYFNQMWTVL